MNSCDQYYAAASAQLEKVFTTQRIAIEQAADWLGRALAADQWLYAFGTGHSHMLAEEIFYRAGGLAHGVPMLDSQLMLHENAIQATHVERREGYAEGLLNQYPVQSGDVLVVASNSGRNAVPIELAMAARERGLKVVAVVNLEHGLAWRSRHPSGRNLADVSDLVIDNCGIAGDACLELPGLPSKVGPTSSITGMFIINAVVVRAMEIAVALGKAPEIYISSNSDGDQHNEVLLSKYRSRIRHL